MLVVPFSGASFTVTSRENVKNVNLWVYRLSSHITHDGMT
jgi:hypothetical protein